MARLSHFNIGAAIARMEDFKSNTGSFRGQKVSFNPSSGRMPSAEAEKMAGHNVDYVVHSYATPIAYHHEGGWEYPDVSYSSTTSKHQAITRGAIGIKSARDKQLEERAARVAAKQKRKSESQEQTLWNS
jgi:hypothetical protein